MENISLILPARLKKSSIPYNLFFILGLFLCAGLASAADLDLRLSRSVINESAGTATIEVKMFLDENEIPAESCTISGRITYVANESSATEGVDFSIPNPNFVITIDPSLFSDGGPDSTIQNVTVQIVDDSIVEGENNEEVGRAETAVFSTVVTQANCGVEFIGVNDDTLYIVDNDEEVEPIANATIDLEINADGREFSEESSPFDLSVSLSFGLGSLPRQSCSVNGEIAVLGNGTTATEGSDFSIATKQFSVSITRGEGTSISNEIIEITITDDSEVEGSTENVVLGVTNISNDCGIETITFSGENFSIRDNDEEIAAANARIELNLINVNEGDNLYREDEGSVALTVDVLFDEGALPAQSCSISGDLAVLVNDIAATEGEDFTIANKGFSIFYEPNDLSEGKTQKTTPQLLSIVIIDDDFIDGTNSEAGIIEKISLGVTNITNDCGIETFSSPWPGSEIYLEIYIGDNDEAGNSEAEPEAPEEPAIELLSEKAGLNKQQVSIAEALDNSCTAISNLVSGGAGGNLTIKSNEQSLLSICNQLQSSTSLSSDLDQLSPKKFSAMRELAIRGGMQQSENLSKQLARTRQGGRGFDVSDLSLNVYGQRIAGRYLNEALGAGAGEIQSDWSAFVGGSVQVGEYDQQDFDLQGNNIYAGLNYQLNSAVIIGAALGYNKSDASFNQKGSDISFESYNVALLGSYYVNDDFYLDSVFTYGANDYGTDRRVVIGASTQQNVGDVDGSEMTLAINTGYTFNASNYFFTLFAALNYLDADINEFDEEAKGSSPLLGSLLILEDQDFKSFTTNVGLEFGFTLSTKTGVIVPKLSVDWEQQHEDEAGLISTRFLADPTNTSWDVNTDVVDDNYYNAALSLNAVFKNGFSTYLMYNTELGREDISIYEVSVGARWEF